MGLWLDLVFLKTETRKVSSTKTHIDNEGNLWEKQSTKMELQRLETCNGGLHRGATDANREGITETSMVPTPQTGTQLKGTLQKGPSRQYDVIENIRHWRTEYIIREVQFLLGWKIGKGTAVTVNLGVEKGTKKDRRPDD